MIGLTDMFCGAGGSSTGAALVPDIEITCAANHADNHPTTDHRCADLSQVDPRLFPRTDMGWFSPSCTNHSIAQGRKQLDKQPDLFGEILPDEAAERSRATMWDVIRFSEHHRYKIVIVENVVDVHHWPPFQAWLTAMRSLGYQHRIMFINSMHAHVFGDGAPQSRDREYIAFHLEGNPRPDWERITRPRATCPECGPVQALQVWKRPDRQPWGRYRAQYIYRCPNATCRNQIVEPAFRPASDIIDWKLEGQRIGDRAKPLSEKTMGRIRHGIAKYWGSVLVPVEGREGKASLPVDRPARTMTTRSETGLAVPPFAVELRGTSTHRLVSQPLSTVTASGNHHGLVTAYYGNGTTVPTSEALSTVTTVDRHALLTRGAKTYGVDDVRFRMMEPREQKRAMDFPADYTMRGTRREQTRLAGNAVCPPNARDLVGVGAETLR